MAATAEGRWLQRKFSIRLGGQVGVGVRGGRDSMSVLVGGSLLAEQSVSDPELVTSSGSAGNVHSLSLESLSLNRNLAAPTAPGITIRGCCE